MNERSIFMEALDKDTEAQRSAYLDQTCGADTDLRQRVEALLQSHGDAGCFLGKPVPQRLAENIGNPADSEATQGESSEGDPGDEGLEFLTPSDKPDSIGRLGHYEILEVIGRGGMGIVLRAFDEKLHRVVAIKVMAAQLATNATARKRFTREAQAAAAVTHDHIVTIHAVEEANGLPYLVMQYVSGMSLQQRLDRNGPLELREIVRIGMQTAAGLAAAHDHGLIHRDIKPANILLENGVERVKITDFGLARAVADASLTQSGVVAGTPQYMSPEQARGDAVDQRTDQFSLGSVLYAMCTGRPPFRADSSMAVLKRVCDDTPSAIGEANSEIPDWLVAIIAKLHAKASADRFQSAAEVAELLKGRLAHLQHPSLIDCRLQIADLRLNDSKPSQSAIVNLKPAILKRRRWAAAAVVILFLIAGLSLTEAAGLTNLRATVIRIFTPDGTLVVEVDDPAVKVTIEGDGGMVITGAGPQEVRLCPGNYKVRATKDGKPVRNEELVTITRGDKRLVRVSHEPAAGAGVQKTAKSSGESPPVDAKLLAELAGYDATLTENPNDLTALLKRADVLRRLRRFDDAVAVYSQIITNPFNQADRKSALFYRAVMHAERGHLQNTIEDYEAYLRLGAPTENAWCYGRLATCYTFGPEKLRNPKRALEHAETAVQKRDANASFHTLHGVCLYRLGRHREAIEVLERTYEGGAKNKDGHTAMNRFFAAMAYQSLGNPAKAQECYDQARKLPQSRVHPRTDGVEQMRAEAESVLKIAAKK